MRSEHAQRAQRGLLLYFYQTTDAPQGKGYKAYVINTPFHQGQLLSSFVKRYIVMCFLKSPSPPKLVGFLIRLKYICNFFKSTGCFQNDMSSWANPHTENFYVRKTVEKSHCWLDRWVDEWMVGWMFYSSNKLRPK